MQIKELGDESFNAPSELRDTEKASLSSSGDSSFSKFVGSFDNLHSLITAYFLKEIQIQVALIKKFRVY